MLRANGAGQRLFAGRGDDGITVNGAGNVIHGGPDTNTITLNGAGQSVVLDGAGRDEIHGFRPRSGNVLDLTQVLAQAQLDLGGDLGRLGAYVRVSTSGTDAALSFNPARLASGAGATLAVLHGAGANTTLATLIASDALRIA